MTKNSSYKQHSQELILIALSDGQWHRNKELKEKTKLSSRTLSKHLIELEKELQWVERREDTESGEYPHPVLYKAKHPIDAYATYMKSIFKNAENIENKLKETKDPLQILEEIHKLNQYHLAIILKEIQEKKHMTQKQIDFMTNLFLCSPYEFYTKKLITTFRKAVQFGTQFDINQLRQNYDIRDGTAPQYTKHT